LNSSMLAASFRKSISSSSVARKSSMIPTGLASSTRGTTFSITFAQKPMIFMSARTRSWMRGRWILMTTSSPVRRTPPWTCLIHRREDLADRLPQPLLDDLIGELGRERRHPVEALLELVGVAHREESRAGGHHLAELDVGRPEILEDPAHDLREGHLLVRDVS